MKKLSVVLTLVAVFVIAFTAVFAAPVAAAGSSQTIVETALAINADTGEFSTLIAAVVYTGLVPTLNGRGQFTVFAPTGAAFAKLGLDAESIVTLPKGTVKNILLYHVARGERLSGDVVCSSRIRMMNKQFTFVSLKDGGAHINDAMILAVDVPAKNGVIHVIDTVLLPK
ncbi:MAG TPA: fasciclin domain-containing protein [Levilinea sp.]|nr:fasciclin domain-containing protein [Levilinea sp.]